MTSFASSRMGDSEPDMVILSEDTNILQRCVNFAPKKHRIKPYPIGDLNDLRIQQGLIIKDLLFSLIGYEGFYIRFSEKYDPFNVDSKIRGPDFKVAKHLDVSIKSITKKLVRFGKYYSGLQGFLEVYDHQNFGKVVQRLCFIVSEFLVKYQEVILTIENDFKFNANFNINVLEQILNQKISSKLTHLYEIVLTIHNENYERSKLDSNDMHFEEFLANVRKTLKATGAIDTGVSSGNFEYVKGGLILKIIQSRIHSYKGDTLSLEFLSTLFDSVSTDYVSMLNKWLINGEIDDSFDEFLIKKKEVPANLSELFDSQGEHYWSELFVVRSDGLIDQFQNRDIQLKILNTGKFLNVFKICTGWDNFEKLNEILEPISELFSSDLELKINCFYERANKLFMKLLFEGYNLKALLDYFQSTFLFSDSFKIDNFLNKSYLDLKRNRYSISITRLQKIYDETFRNDLESRTLNLEPVTGISGILNRKKKFSISSSNFYDIAREIMNVQSFDTENVLNDDPNFQKFLNKTFERTYIRSADSSKPEYDANHADEYTIASVDLCIELPFPLNLIINRELSYHYELMFKLQMMIKFISKFNDHTWKEINHSYVWKYSEYKPHIKKWILRCRILHTRMRDFFNELQFYLNYDVIDVNYKSLRESVLETEILLKNRELGSDVHHSSLNSSAFKHGGLSSYNNSNALFENKIHNSQLNRTKPSSSLIEINTLISNLNEFLNTIVNDSLITKHDLLEVLKKIFDVIISFNNYLTRLKKGLILCDEELFSKFSKDYPNKFNEQSMDANSIANRFEGLNESLKDHYENFSNSLTEFILTLKSYGEVENKQILVLSERLEKCFPEK